MMKKSKQFLYVQTHFETMYNYCTSDKICVTQQCFKFSVYRSVEAISIYLMGKIVVVLNLVDTLSLSVSVQIQMHSRKY